MFLVSWQTSVFLLLLAPQLDAKFYVSLNPSGQHSRHQRPFHQQATTDLDDYDDDPPSPPPLPPKVAAALYLAAVNNIPMELYSCFLCGLYKQPRKLGQREVLGSPENFAARLQQLKIWLSSKEQHVQVLSITHSYVATILKSLRTQLLAGFTTTQLDELRHILSSTLTVEDLDQVAAAIFKRKTYLAEEAAATVQPFYVESPESSSQNLDEKDKKRLLVDVILSANGRGACAECGINFKTSNEMATVLFKNVLPKDLSRKKMDAAISAMMFVSSAKLTSQDTTIIFQNMVHGKY